MFKTHIHTGIYIHVSIKMRYLSIPNNLTLYNNHIFS